MQLLSSQGNPYTPFSIQEFSATCTTVADSPAHQTYNT